MTTPVAPTMRARMKPKLFDGRSAGASVVVDVAGKVGRTVGVAADVATAKPIGASNANVTFPADLAASIRETPVAVTLNGADLVVIAESWIVNASARFDAGPSQPTAKASTRTS